MKAAGTLVERALMLALIWAMVAALLVSLAGFWGEALSPGPLALLAAGAVLAALPGWRYPLAWAVGLALAVLAGLAVPAAHAYLDRHGIPVLAAPAGAAAVLAAQGREWAVGVLQWRFKLLPPELTLLFLAALGVAVAWHLGRAAWLTGRWTGVLTTGAVLFAAQWLLTYQSGQPLVMAYLMLALLLWAVAGPHSRRRRWAAARRRWAGAVQSSILVAVSAVGVAILAGLAVPALPRWLGPALALERVRQTSPVLAAMRRDGGRVALPPFDIGQVGFGGGAAALGGPLTLRDDPAFRVRLRLASDMRVDDPDWPPLVAGNPAAPAQEAGGPAAPAQEAGGPAAAALATDLYLRGSVHTVYTGSAWLPPAPEPRVTLAPGAPFAGQTVRTPLQLRVETDVIPETLYTRTLFHLLAPVAVDGAGAYDRNADATLTAHQPPAAGQPYTVTSLVSLGKPIPVGFARLSGADRRRLGAYLSLPDRADLGPVADLARSVTNGRRTPLDRALALTGFLSTGYTYALAPPAPPPDQDFVHHFLFTAREGYCTAFASALAVMLRQVGIPSRWVQGFVLPAGTTAAADGTYVVRDRQAHAWVEAYIAGYGWLTLDPTPRTDFLAPADSAPDTATAAGDTPAAAAGAETDGPLANPDPDDLALPGAGGDGAGGWERLLGLLEGVRGGHSAGLPDWPWATGGPDWGWGWGVALGAATLGAAALGAGLVARRRYRSRGRTPAERLQLRFVTTVEHLARAGYGPAAGWSPQAYARRLGAEWPEVATAAHAAAAAYASARYGPPDLELPPGAGAAVDNFAQAARRALAQRYGRLRLAWYRLRPRPAAAGFRHPDPP